MSGLMKVLTGILGVMAVIACLATVGIIGYSMTGAGAQKNKETASAEAENQVLVTAVPTQTPEEGEPAQSAEPVSSSEPVQTPRPINDTDHIHDYEETMIKRATCYSAGRIRYRCECGDEYYVDIMSTGHVAGDWEITRIPTAERDGIRVQKCIYCDDIVAQENVPFEDAADKDKDGEGDGGDEDETPHVHQYTAEVVREPSCILAGLRKYTCSCGNFYTEMIPAPGHVATDWTVAEEPTTSYMGTEQRTCSVCGVVLDSRPVPMLSPSPSASTGTSGNTQSTTQPSAAMTVVPTSGGSTSTQSASPNASATPSATPHSHQYKSYVLKEANCTEKGIRSFVCNCGSSYAESIELDLNRHSYRAVVIPPTRYTSGQTVYTCVRCNYSYFDNLTPALGQ
ncbi:MAG: hypothetical protein NC429_14060 [Lachnospiraceae bacterium]|nr:hypothetical protein [Lachnospiraceae bacterium]